MPVTTEHVAAADDETTYDLLDRDDEPFAIRGRLLGFGTSHAEQHTHPPGAEPVAADPDDPVPTLRSRQRCPACRWFEARIFRASAEVTGDECTCAGGGPECGYAHEPHCGLEPARARYLVLTYGRSELPGEIQRRRAAWTDSEFEVIELLTQRGSGGKFIPQPAALALAQAASLDDDLREAYVNRAVA